MWRSALLVTAVPLICAADPCGKSRTVTFDAQSFRLIERESGPINYYRIAREGDLSFIRAEYKPPLKTSVLGIKLEDEQRARASHLEWSWRAMTLPKGGDECTDGKGDSAAVIYATWKRGLRWYTLKYVWSSVAPAGSICARKRNPFVAQDTVVLRSGGPLGTWQHQQIDLRTAFRKHFADGDPKASVPDFIGVAIMSDGDQTQSESAADYARFSIRLNGDCG